MVVEGGDGKVGGGYGLIWIHMTIFGFIQNNFYITTHMRGPTPSIVPTFVVLAANHSIIPVGGSFVAVGIFAAKFAVMFFG